MNTLANEDYEETVPNDTKEAHKIQFTEPVSLGITHKDVRVLRA